MKLNTTPTPFWSYHKNIVLALFLAVWFGHFAYQVFAQSIILSGFAAAMVVLMLWFVVRFVSDWRKNSK